MIRHRLRLAALLGVVAVAFSALSSFSVISAQASLAATYTIWHGTPYIANLAVPDGKSVEVGVKFRTDLPGVLTGIRFFKGPGNTGTHIGNLWTSNGILLATTTFTDETATGWQQASFVSPVSIDANVTYIASYFAPNGHYALTSRLSPGDFTAAVDNPPLHALATGADGANGVYAYASASSFPSQGSLTANNYWVDVLLNTTVTTSPVVDAFSPMDGASGVALTSQVVAHFSEELQPSTLSFTLTDPNGAIVPVRVTWELHQMDRTITLDPEVDLAAGSTYTASLSGGTDQAGNVMTPVAWSFTTTGTAEPPHSVFGQWQPTQSWPMVTVHGSVLRTGQFLGWDPQSPVTTSQIYDPTNGSFTPASMILDMFCAGMAQMADGRLLVAGGDHGDNPFPGATYGDAIASTVAYDPVAGTWTRLADMHLRRWYPALVRLSDGRILAISGQVNSTTWSDTPEVYDPASNTWTLLSQVNTSDVREELYPNAYLLPDGRVLVIATSTGHTWILDVNAQTWTQGPTAPIHDGSTVMYRPGRVLLSGGSLTGYGSATIASAAILDMTVPSPAWQMVAPMHYARGYHQLIVLPDGRVLAVGGSTVFSTSSTTGVFPSEIWDPDANAWAVGASMQDGRMNHSVGVLMPDATALAAGGGHEMGRGSYDFFTAETYLPPYLYAGARPTISSVPTSAGYGSTITVQTPDASNVGSVALIGLSAETHHYDSGAGYRSLSFTPNSGQLDVQMPASAASAPPGYYMLFLVSTAGIPSMAAMVQLTGTDATPPAVAAVTPANGSIDAQITTAPTVTFTKPVQSNTIQFSLQDSAGNPVPTSTSYSTATDAATFTPGSFLSYSTTYTATLTSAADQAGQLMQAPFSWSFTTARPPTCPCTLWSSSTTPGVASSTDTNSVELGVKFEPDTGGYITNIQFYKGPSNTGSHIGNLWTGDGTLLATVAFTSETATGWQSATLQSPVPVGAGKAYVVSYHAPAGGYAFNRGYFTTSPYDNSPLHAFLAGGVGGNGVYAYSPTGTFPTTPSSSDANYWVDVTFVQTLPSGSPPAVAATTPVDGATPVAVTVAPSATFNEAVQASSIKFALTDQSGAAIAGSMSYDVVRRTATFTPTSSLAYGSTFTATVSNATDANGATMSSPVSWSFTTPSCPCTIWSASAVPGTTAASDGGSVEVGLKFSVDSNGYISGLRFYKGAGNAGTHIGDLWTASGTRLATVTFTNENSSGWQSATFDTAVPVTAGTIYVISYLAPKGHYAYDPQYFYASGVDNPPLHALQAVVARGNGTFVYSSSSAFPANASAASMNYWVDPIFVPTAP